MKESRLDKILKLTNESGFIKIADAAKSLNVTQMTIRRDLEQLEQRGEVVRIHGGARRLTKDYFTEHSHQQKERLNVDEKKYVAMKAAELIEDDDTVFIGPGTTTEFMYEFLDVESATIITNSISILNSFQENKKLDVILIGGRLREQTKSFVGYFTSNWIKDINVKKSFIGTNGIFENNITTADEEEGALQKTIINNSQQNYIVSDSSKFGTEAFQVICSVDEVDGIITDKLISRDTENYYKTKCKIIY